MDEEMTLGEVVGILFLDTPLGYFLLLALAVLVYRVSSLFHG